MPNRNQQDNAPPKSGAPPTDDTVHAADALSRRRVLGSGAVTLAASALAGALTRPLRAAELPNLDAIHSGSAAPTSVRSGARDWLAPGQPGRDYRPVVVPNGAKLPWKIVDGVKANPALWADTAILVTADEGGGYYDSGYVQPVDFFGDGTRIPMIAVSKFTSPGHISHEYTDHVSILKFIERNWDLKPVSKRSRDNLPNPKTIIDPYVPVNGPAIGDLFDLFDFKK